MQEGWGSLVYSPQGSGIVGRASGRAPKYIDSAARPMKFMLLLVVGIQELLFKFLFSSNIGSVLGEGGAFFST